MNKKLTLILAVMIAIVAILIFFNLYGGFEDTGTSETNAETNTDTETETQKIERTDCPELNLVIEKVECVYNQTGINISIFRRQDPFGRCKLIIYATDINNENQTISRKLNSSETARFILGVTAGLETTITSDLEIIKDDETIVCKGPTEIHSCSSTSTQESNGVVPPPTGAITSTDQRDDTREGYFCNNVTNPKHQIRVYTYKNIGGVRNFSTSYIESSKVENVCDNYLDKDTGVYYNVRWRWNPVENIDGYRIYQYYALNSTYVPRDYNYYVDIGTIFSELTDTGLNLWRIEK